MRNYVRFLLKVGALLCVLLCFCVYSAFFRMDYMDYEAPLWLQQQDYVLSGQGAAQGVDCLVLGDSRAKAGILPGALSDGAYNLSLSGVSSVELYYALQNYLAHAPAPKTVVIAIGSYHHTVNHSFWKRTVYFHYLAPGEMADLFRAADGLQEETFLGSGYRSAWLPYLLYLPNIYGGALAKGTPARAEENRAIYAGLERDKGYYFYGQSQDLGRMPEEDWDSFSPDPLIALYMDRLLSLCRDSGIGVMVASVPVAQSALERVSPEYLAGYDAHMAALAAAYPHVRFDAAMRGYPDELCAEASHLNRAGAEAYTAELALQMDTLRDAQTR